MRICAAMCFALLLIPLSLGQGQVPPQQGYVPDSETAIKIAEAVLIPVYGKRTIASERPFTAKLKESVWRVSGTLHCPDGKGGTTTSCKGGVAVVEISKVDGRILFLAHYK